MKSVTRFTPELLIFLYVVLFLCMRHPSENWDRIINSDGKGYYAYLTSVFIYHDPDYKYIESYEARYYPANLSVFKDFRTSVDGKIVNKCFPGIAILWLPFFLIAHFLSYIFGFATDGYSSIYQYAIAVAALFYCWLALKILVKLLTRLGASDKLAAFIVILIALGTNLLFFTVIECSMSHVYSFFLITSFIYAALRFFETHDSRWIPVGCVLFALIILVRPTNGLVLLLVPAMAVKQRSFSLTALLQSPHTVRNLVTGFALMALLFFIPMWMWHQQTGRWIVYSYGDEALNFSQPHFLSILFSYNRGWFVYTPIAFLSLVGFAGLWKENRSRFFWIMSFLLVFTYVMSCWWIWYYSSKCGQRVFIDMYVIVAILLFYLYEILRNKTLISIISAILVLLTVLNLLQFYQHASFIFPAQTITRGIYWDSFFSIHPKSKVFLPDYSILVRNSSFSDMEHDLGLENYASVSGEKAYSGTKSSLINNTYLYSAGIVRKPDSLFITDNRVIQVTAWVFPVAVKPWSSLVIDFQANGKSICYNAFYFEKNARADRWTKVEFALYVPQDLPKNSIVKVYFYHDPASGSLYIDDLKVDFLSLRGDYESRHIEGISLPCK